MTRFVLVHGACHGAWCWERVVPLLEAAGHEAVAFDLPGAGDDKTPHEAVTLDTYVERTVAAIGTEGEPVVLVGHSLAGLTISQTAERVPDRIRALVYLTAYMLADGQSGRANPHDNPGSLVEGSRQMVEENVSYIFGGGDLKAAFYGECGDDVVEAARPRLVPQPVAIATTPLRLSAERYGRIPRIFIECARDRTLTPAFQQSMQAAQLCDRVFTMDSDHSPFYSAPEELAGHLMSV